MNFNKYLKQPYPFPYQNWLIISIISLSIGFLMLFMQPFGLSEVKIEHKKLFLLGYGLVTFIILSLNQLYVNKFFNEDGWNIGRQILWNFCGIFILGLANYVYTHFFGNLFLLNISSILIFQVYTFFIAIVPITFLILINQNRLLKLNVIEAKVIMERLQPNNQHIEKNDIITLIADNGKDQITIAVSNLIFIESIGNYLHVYYFNNEDLAQKTLRCSISKIENQIINYKVLLKCHRAFIVNLNFITTISGNAQGYRLNLKNCDKVVHVSRQYTKILKDSLNS